MKYSPQTQALLQHSAIAQKVIKKADSHLSLHGISFTEFLIMSHLNDAHENTMRRIDLALAVGLSASGVTRLIAPMDKNRLVEKKANPRDARVSLVALSENGKAVFVDAAQTLGYLADELYANFKQKDLQVLSRLEEKIATGLS